jgi:4-aminobutyrate aminotransferase-like enzyme
MGFGAMLAGHLNPTVVAKVKKSLDDIGTLFVTPSPVSTDVAEKFKERFGLDMLRFTNSGTESTMYAVRVARAYTGRKEIIKIEGGYHGGYDGLSVSVKPGIDEIGPADNPIRRCPSMPSPRRARGGLQRPRPDGTDAGRQGQERRLCGDGTGHREPRHRVARRRLPGRCSRAVRRPQRAADLRRSEDRPHRRRPRRGR